MPKFTDMERESIETALEVEGEKLFSIHGLKKVTVDDLAKAANISKGSFYAFYPSKEHLFATINMKAQDRFFKEIIDEIKTYEKTPAKKFAINVFKAMFNKAKEWPILKVVDNSTIEHLQRKLPKEMFDKHTCDDVAVVKILEEYGVVFGEDVSIATKTLQAIAVGINAFEGDEDEEKILDSLISGVVNLMK